MSIKFSEYKPSLPLMSFVQSYWTGEFNLNSENNFIQSVVPNGCLELIIHLSNNHCELIKGDLWNKSPEFTLIGLQKSTYQVKFNETVKVFGVRFNLEGIYNLFGIPPANFTSIFEDSKQVLGNDFDEYCLRLRDKKTDTERIFLTEKFLLRKLGNSSVNKSDYLNIATKTIRKNNGIISLDSLIAEVPISARQLQREFKNKFGITAKEYMRMSRFNAVQNYFQGVPKVNLTELSYDQGFSDQSHFIRDFKILTGINPKGFLKKRENFIVNPAN